MGRVCGPPTYPRGMPGTIFLSRDYYLKVVPIELKFSAKVAAEKIVDNSTFHEIIIWQIT